MDGRMRGWDGEFVYGCDGEECYLEMNEFPEVRYYKKWQRIGGLVP